MELEKYKRGPVTFIPLDILLRLKTPKTYKYFSEM